jgi:CheY-like chemotaxis protein
MEGRDTKRVLSVGQCCKDHATLSDFLGRNFNCQIVEADGPEETLHRLSEQEFDLVLVNRKLDRDYSDGIEVIRRLKAEPATAHVPVMLITNYPEHQEAAVAAGAVRGFGKLEFNDPRTRERLAAVLSES